MEDSVKPKVTPKDFFLWLGAMVTLYVSATSLILLVHAYIEHYFPNQLVTYGDPYSGTIRFAIASLIVMFPLYVLLTRMIHEDIRATPLKKELWVRRWLVFLTLFVAGLTIAIDLIAVVYVFLNGEITTRFILKALTILVVLGGGFWYYIHELRGTWEAKKNLSQTIAGIVSVVVLVSIAAAFFIIGSPQSERLMRLDDQKVSDLQNIQWQVVNYWQQKQTLPKTLTDLSDPISGFVVPVDAQTGGEYTYRPTGPLSFELCATFNRDARDLGRGTTKAIYEPSGLTSENWQHKGEMTCFARTIDPERYPPIKK